MDNAQKNRANISIIISTLNAGDCLQGCLDSIKKQTIVPQLIVIDGGSEDETITIIKKNSDIISFWSSEADQGIYDAWNKGLKQAQNDWIYFLGADDRFYADNVLFEVSQFLVKIAPEQLLAYGNICFVDKRGKQKIVGSPWKEISKSFQYRNTIPHQGVFHRKELFAKHGNFDLTFKIAGDYALLIKEVVENPPQYLDVPPISYMHAGGVSSRNDKSWVVLLEFAKASFKYWNMRASICWLYFFSRACVKRILLPVFDNR